MVGISPVLKEEKLDYSDFIEKLNLPEYNENYNIFTSTPIEAPFQIKQKTTILQTETIFPEIPIMQQEKNSFNYFSSKYGWFLYCLNSKFYSQHYSGKETNLKIKDEIIVIVNMEKKKINFYE